MNRISPWNKAKQDAGVTEFRRLLDGHRQDQVRNAMRAGKSLAKLMANAYIVITGIDDVQLERYRRRFAVPESLKAIMYATATGKRFEWMKEDRHQQKFPVERCKLCFKHRCRCERRATIMVQGKEAVIHILKHAEGGMSQQFAIFRLSEAGIKGKKAVSCYVGHTAVLVPARQANKAMRVLFGKS